MYNARPAHQIKQQQEQQQHLLPDYIDHRRYVEVTPEMIGQRKRPSLLSEFHPSPAMSSSMKEVSRQALVMPPQPSIMQSMHHVQPQDLGPYANKRQRLSIDGRPDLQQPLRIDTRDIDMKREPAYTPQVEAISPTPMDDLAAKNNHAEMLSNLEKLDRDIQTHENKILMLQKKKQQLEERARMPPEERPASPTPSYLEGYHSLAQIIYTKNKHNSHQAHEELNKLGPPVDLPLYNQPSDATIFADNIAKFAAIKKRLVLFFRRRQRVRNIREKYLMDRYEQMMKSWTKKMERIENSTRRRAKDAKAREIFEKVFPEIKKQREDKDRLQRVGANRVGVARSDADLEQIADGLHEQEEEERKMRSLAVIPPLLLDIKQRQLRYANTNGILDDPMTNYKNRQLCNVWTQAEKNIFREKFLLHPKNFTFIASFLQQKSVSDCVQYYYLSKKTENYKQLVRKQARKKGGTRLTRPQEEGENFLGATTTVNQQECQLGTCKTPKRKVKQLRPLPASFAELPVEQREEIIKEYQIPEGITKCCPACYNRIMRRVGAGAVATEPVEGTNELAGDEPVATGPWTQEEIDTAVAAFREHGRNWSAIAAAVKTRTEQQCMDFYKLQLHTEKKPATEDEEKKTENDKDIRQSVCESIASTVTAPSEVDMMSSDDEHDESSDTASASSPGPPPVGGPPPLPPPFGALLPSSSSLPNSNDHFLADKPPRAVGDDDRVAGSSGGGPPLPPALTTSRASVHSNVDNDSSATMSADEGPPTELSITTSAPSGSGGHGHSSGRHQPPAAAVSSEARKAVCMRDVIHSTIEQSVQENTGFSGGLAKYYNSKEFTRPEQRPDLSRVIHLAPPGHASPAHMIDGRHSTSPVPFNSRAKPDAPVYRGDPREIYPRVRPRDDSTPPPAAHSHHARPASGAPNMATSLDHLAAAAEVKSMMDVRASPQVVPGGLGGGAVNAAELVGLQMVPSGALSWPQAGIGQPPPLVNVNRRSNEDNHYSIMHGIPGGNGLLPGRGVPHGAGVRGGGSISRGTPVYESPMPHLTPAQQPSMMRPRMQEAPGQRLSPESAAAAAALYQQQQNHQQQLQHQQMESPSTKMILINDFQTASMMHQRGAAALQHVRQLSPHGMAPPPPRLSPIDGVQALSPQHHMLMNAARPVGVVWPQVASQLSPAHHLSPTSPPSRHPAYINQGPTPHHRLSPQSKVVAAAAVGRSSLETLAQVATDPRVVVAHKYAPMGQHGPLDDDVKVPSMRSPDHQSLTAAKLIDAIITSQISRGDVEIKKPNSNILGHLDTTVSMDGGIRSLTASHTPRLQYGVAPGPGQPVDLKPTYMRGAEMPATARPPPPSLPPIAETPGGKSLTLGEHIDAIIHEDYNKPPSEKEREMTSAKAIKTLMFSNSSSSEDSPQAPNDTPDSNNWAAPPSALMVNGQLQALGSLSNSNNRPRSYSQGTRGMSKVAPFMNTQKPSSRGYEVSDKEKARQLLSKSSLRPFALNKNSADGRPLSNNAGHSLPTTGSTITQTSTVQAGSTSSQLTMSTLAATHQTVTSLLTAAPCYPINDAARLNASRSTTEALSPRRVDNVDQSRSASRSASSDGEKSVVAAPTVEQAASDSHEASAVVAATERGEAATDSNAALSPKLTIASPPASPLPPSENGANVPSGPSEVAASSSTGTSEEIVTSDEQQQGNVAVADGQGQGRSPLLAPTIVADAAASEASPRLPPAEVMQIRRPLARLDSYDKSPESELVIDESVPSAEPADGSPAAPLAEETGTEGDVGDSDGFAKDAVKVSVEGGSIENGATGDSA